MAKSSKKTEKPSFFKILIMDDFHTRLRLPPAFVRKNNGFVQKRFVTLVSKHGSWKVYLKKMDRDFYFHKGWEKFAKDHLLGFGDFLVFKKVQASTFKVKSFDPSCCEKEDKNKARKNRVEVKEEVIYFDDDLGNKYGKGETSVAAAKRGSKNFDNEEIYLVNEKGEAVLERLIGQNVAKNETEVICIEDLGDDENGKTSLAAAKRGTKNFHERMRCLVDAKGEGEKSNSKHPFFCVAITNTYAVVQNRYLKIPVAFIRKYMMGNKDGQYVELVNSRGNVWSVRLFLSFRGRRFEGRLTAGWPKFAEANNVEVGDVCGFEMVKSGDVVFKVHIFKG